ncbi:phosphate ABC transporter permease [Sphaerospermopsis aphanizomenoides BCCUSP55]|uniref:phosphate ABC transporter permease n=1 Tax=Sphaerospermopsis aphanizomenoides TaxID=459663 RepID=UPI000AB5D74D|nr:phosphate ABC transporter permease [Sphaerospermopsis aphanizomenoides]MBK1990554.1 phosphate ABC transporter permease [Sphaerospermopsis aphanizomenoides BCCUSP55]
MLVPLTRQKFEQIIPLIASGPQYKYYWGKFNNFLQRVLISVVTVVVIFLIKSFFRLDFGLVFVFGVFGAFFWLWYPVFQASIRNVKCRRYKYSGFFRGRVLDWWITEKLIGKQETVNNKGELVIIENREKRINLELGDDTGFSIEFDAPLRPTHKAIARGQVAEMVVMSNRPDLSSIEEFSNIYIPSRNLWVSDYPLVRQDLFNEVSLRLRENQQQKPRRRSRPAPQEYRDDDDY